MPLSAFNSEQLLAILRTSKDATAIYSDQELTIAFVNEAMLRIWAKDAGVQGQRFEDALPEMQGQPFTDLLKETWRSGRVYEAEDTAADILVDGTLKTFYFDFCYRPLPGADGRTYALLHTATDVTDRVLGKAAQEMLANEQALNEELAAANEELSATMEELDAHQQELARLNTGLEQEVAERTRAAETARARLEAMVMRTPIAMTVLRGEELIVEVANQPMLDVWRRTAEQVLGRGLTDIFPELPGQADPEHMRSVLRTGERFALPETEVLLATVSGELKKHYARSSYDPLRGPDGAVDSVLVTVIDITGEVQQRWEMAALNEELKASNDQLYRIGRDLDDANAALSAANSGLRLENASLLASETKTLSLFAEAPVAIGLLTGPELYIESANARLLELWGKDALILGLPLAEAIPELEGQPFLALLEDVLRTGRPFYGNEIKASVIADGQFIDRYFNFAYQAVRNDDGEFISVMLVATDVSAQVEARRAIEAAEERFRLIADNIAQFAWMADASGHIYWYNQRWFEYTGTTLAEMAGWGWRKVHHPDHVDRVVERIARCFREGTPWEDTFPLRRADGEYRWFLSRAVPTLDADGKPLSWFGTNTDITEQRLLSDQKDDFISIASHELKTPLTSLRASLQLLERMGDELHPLMAPKLISGANKSMQKINALVEDLLNIDRFSKGRLQLQRTTFSVKQMLDLCCNHVRAENKYELLVEGEPGILMYADEHRIDQVVVNFVNNAIKYAPASKQIRLRADRLPGEVRISVSDKGPGIPEDQLPHLFDRYWRADHGSQHYSGLGLGLFICAEIVRRHGGRIGADSVPGEGSTFWFTVPEPQN